ncbi:TIGR04086 family membrane protein [Entomomonas asaccharolytica]|uniref:CAP-Gly protein n=1 Tax=Entomomonas asaccharolytica TaxID=2785331 RepID=A0A974RXM7_9GAMM|nr:TIGR04086 family membrane protein [Entomomonas asaccharolytica]QQP86317.1 hypothetical protein JHT90_03485 [Entomomonas asaccharolytica]
MIAYEAEAKRVSWGSIIAGLVTVLAVSILFSTLGTSLGFAVLSPKSDQPFEGVGITMLIWTVLTVVVSLAAGGFVAGRLAGIEGKIHGFLVWATTLIVSVILTSMMLSSAVQMAGSTIGAVGSATGSVVSGVGSVVGSSVTTAAKGIEKIFESINIDTDVSGQELQQNIKQALQNSGVDALQPNYLQNQLKKSAKDVQSAVKQIALNPDDADKVIDNLSKTLKERADTVTSKIDREDVVRAIRNNSNLSDDEINQIVDNYIEARTELQQTIEERLQDTEELIAEAKATYQDMKVKAIEAADQAASAVAKIACWSFIALLLGAIVSTLTGCLGVRYYARVYRREVV